MRPEKSMKKIDFDLYFKNRHAKSLLTFLKNENDFAKETKIITRDDGSLKVQFIDESDNVLNISIIFEKRSWFVDVLTHGYQSYAGFIDRTNNHLVGASEIQKYWEFADKKITEVRPVNNGSLNTVDVFKELSSDISRMFISNISCFNNLPRSVIKSIIPEKKLIDCLSLLSKGMDDEKDGLMFKYMLAFVELKKSFIFENSLFMHGVFSYIADKIIEYKLSFINPNERDMFSSVEYTVKDINATLLGERIYNFMFSLSIKTEFEKSCSAFITPDIITSFLDKVKRTFSDKVIWKLNGIVPLNYVDSNKSRISTDRYDITLNNKDLVIVGNNIEPLRMADEKFFLEGIIIPMFKEYIIENFLIENKSINIDMNDNIDFIFTLRNGYRVYTCKMRF